jgi:hypothetical protein
MLYWLALDSCLAVVLFYPTGTILVSSVHSLDVRHFRASAAEAEAGAGLDWPPAGESALRREAEE